METFASVPLQDQVRRFSVCAGCEYCGHDLHWILYCGTHGRTSLGLSSKRREQEARRTAASD